MLYIQIETAISRNISRDGSGRKRVSRREKLRLFRRCRRAIFQLAPAAPSARFRGQKKKESPFSFLFFYIYVHVYICSSPSLQKDRRATKVKRARVRSRRFSRGKIMHAGFARLRSRNVDRSKLYTITNPTRNYHVTSLAHCASGNVKD